MGLTGGTKKLNEIGIDPENPVFKFFVILWLMAIIGLVLTFVGWIIIFAFGGGFLVDYLIGEMLNEVPITDIGRVLTGEIPLSGRFIGLLVIFIFVFAIYKMASKLFDYVVDFSKAVMEMGMRKHDPVPAKGWLRELTENAEKREQKTK
jgi:hypothetical protein